MTENVENVENLLLDHGKRMQAEMARARERHSEVLKRFNHIESVLVRLTRDQAQAFADRIEDRHALDALKERIERIEPRLEIIA